MKTRNLLVTTIIALTAISAGAKEIKIDKHTKLINPAKSIGVFPAINWDKLEKRQDEGKEDAFDSQVMMCDDTYLSVVEIEFDGTVGKDVHIESTCGLVGYNQEGWDTTFLHFDGPSGDDGYTCTITIEKKQNNKRIRMNYELTDAC